MMSWTGFLKMLLAHTADWIGPPDERCLVCGDRRNGLPVPSPEAPNLERWLCAGCLRRIPWIRRIACPRCGRPVFCPDCIRRPVRAFAMNRSAVRYSDDMKAWLKLYKFRGDERYGDLLAEMLLPAYERLTAEAAAASRRAGEAAIAGADRSGAARWPGGPEAAADRADHGDSAGTALIRLVRRASALPAAASGTPSRMCRSAGSGRRRGGSTRRNGSPGRPRNGRTRRSCRSSGVSATAASRASGEESSGSGQCGPRSDPTKPKSGGLRRGSCGRGALPANPCASSWWMTSTRPAPHRRRAPRRSARPLRATFWSTC